HKRAHLYDLEHRFQIAVTIVADDAISGQLPFVIEKGEQVHTMEQARALAAQAAAAIPAAVDETAETEQAFVDAELEEVEEGEVEAEAAEGEELAEGAEGRAEDGGRRRRRRRRRGRRGETREEGLAAPGAPEPTESGAPEGEGEPVYAEQH